MKKRSILALSILMGIFCTSTLLFSPVNAEDQENQPKPAVWLQVSPVSKRLYLTPGANYEDSFQVENIGSEDFTFNVYASPYSVTGEDYEPEFIEETKYTQIARWIKFEQSEFDLAVGETQTVKYTVEVPEKDEVPDGGQYAVIFSESGGKKVEGEESSVGGIKTKSRIGLIVYASLGGETRESAELLEISVPTILFSGNITARSKIKNSGNTDFDVTYHFDITPIFSQEMVYQKDETHPILPDTERRVEMLWDKTPLLGIYKANYSITAPGINENKSYLILVVPLFVVIITLLLLTFLIVWIILTIKRRKALRKRMNIPQ
ncbi:hypothetical protein LJC07_06390 [Christensenellaceae bacterium OttesenSCG-928-L17]|nr:hypothetical protein [Christensenellaceae bacterium OttesenSCG-928-L17]